MQVDVAALVDYIGRKDPASRATLRGVPRPAIETIQAQYSVRLPASYIDFLLAMGEDSGELWPLGLTQSHVFSEIIAMQPRGYPTDRLFRVSYETDEMALANTQRFLDLAHGDADDALLVNFEPDADIGALATDGAFTFGESIFMTVFSNLDVFSRPHPRSVSVGSEDPAGRREVKQEAVELLMGLGFVASLPELPRVACLSQQGAAVMVGVYDGNDSVVLRFGCDDRAALEEILARVLSGLPGAKLINTRRREG